MERCGKRNASNSGSESWTGIGVVADCGAVVLIMQWPYGKNGDVTWRSELLQRLQKVRANCKTRNQLSLTFWENRPKTPQHQKFPQIFDVFGGFGRGDILTPPPSRDL